MATISDERLAERQQQYRQQADAYTAKLRRVGTPETVLMDWLSQQRRAEELAALCAELLQRREEEREAITGGEAMKRGCTITMIIPPKHDHPCYTCGEQWMVTRLIGDRYYCGTCISKRALMDAQLQPQEEQHGR